MHWSMAPFVVRPHQGMRDSHVFEDLMQRVDWIRDGTPSVVTPDRVRHVIEVIESGYCAAETGPIQELRTTFQTLPLEAL